MKDLPKLWFDNTRSVYAVTIEQRKFTLGRDQIKAEQRRAELLGQWQDNALPTAKDWLPTIVEVVDAYSAHMQVHYQTQPRSWSRGKAAMKELNQHYGKMRVQDFTVLNLDRLRTKVNTPDKNGNYRFCRGEVNKLVTNIQRCLKWAVSKGMCPVAVYQACLTLEPLQRGRCEARETEKVGPVSRADIDAIQGLVPADVWAMVQLQLLTGARPGEVCQLTAGMIDRSEAVWSAEIVDNKMAYRNQRRFLFFGPQAQALLLPYLLRGADEALFKPGWRPSEKPSWSKQSPGRRDIPQYTTDLYNTVVSRACKRAGIDAWTVNQLRHTRATELKKRYGLESTAAVLGHKAPETSLIYAEQDWAEASRIAGEMG